jgi:hypothetical protein
LTAAALPRGEEDFAELMALGSEENSAGEAAFRRWRLPETSPWGG